MKLSEMTTDQCAEALCRIAQPVANITGDEEFYAAIQHFASPEVRDQPLAHTIEDICRKLIPLALRAHRADLYAIISALTGKTASEIGKQKILQTVGDVRDCFDEDFIAFFTSSAKSAQNPSLQQSGQGAGQ